MEKYVKILRKIHLAKVVTVYIHIYFNLVYIFKFKTSLN